MFGSIWEYPLGKYNEETIRVEKLEDDEEISNAVAIAVSTYNQALKGNVKAIEQFSKLSASETDKEFIDFINS